MTTLPKKKLCWNCEGSVSLAEDSCPYCGVTVQAPSLEGINNSFSPPYRIPNKNQQIPASPYATRLTPEKVEEEKPPEEIKESFAADNSFKSILIPMLLLLSGSVFFLFGLALAMFSQNGVFTLSWNGNFWYAYLTLAILLLFFGWQTMQKLPEE